MKIGIDVESGERSYQELIQGAITAIQQIPELHIFIIGNSSRIKKNYPKLLQNNKITIVEASQIVYMNEKPTVVLRKKESTVFVGIELLRNKIIDVFFSAGNTGATVVTSVVKLGMFKGVKKPAMATFFPRIGGGETLILDIGANPDANENDLYNNALLGIFYYEMIWNIKDPTVGLLNMGVETGKGSIIIKKAYEKLNNIDSFIGNVEGYNVFNGSVDVVVCNGFTGNSILKISEAIKKYFIYKLKKTTYNEKSKFSRFISFLNSNSEIKKKKFNENILPKYYGAAPLLGVNGLVMIGHGKCSKDELVNAIELSYKLYSLKFTNLMNIFFKNN